MRLANGPPMSVSGKTFYSMQTGTHVHSCSVHTLALSITIHSCLADEMTNITQAWVNFTPNFCHSVILSYCILTLTQRESTAVYLGYYRCLRPVTELGWQTQTQKLLPLLPFSKLYPLGKQTKANFYFILGYFLHESLINVQKMTRQLTHSWPTFLGDNGKWKWAYQLEWDIQHGD